MTRVYIANANKQVLHFIYRLPERKQPITQLVPMFGQTKLSPGMGRDEFSLPDIEAIKEQWYKYGLIDIADLESVRRDFEGWIMSVGKPISEEKLKRAVKYRAAALSEKGKKFRVEAALAMAETIKTNTGVMADAYEVSVAEIEPNQGFQNPNDSHVAEGFRISNDAPPGAPTPFMGPRRVG